MAHVVSFVTRRFDPAREKPNDVNPIPGAAVLEWLAAELRAQGFEAGEPQTEDWGWCIDVRNEGVAYLVGASGDREGDSEPWEWIVQIQRSRSVADTLLGRNKLAPDDPLSARIEALVRAQSDFEGVDVRR